MRGSGQFDRFQPNALRLRFRCKVFASVALIHKGYPHRFAPHLLCLLKQFANLHPFVLIGRCCQNGQQLPQGMYGQRYLRALVALMPAIARASATLLLRLQCVAIYNGRLQLRRLPLDLAHQHAQLVSNLLGDTDPETTLCLQIDRVPRW